MGTVPSKPRSKMRSLILLLTFTLVHSGPAPVEVESSVNEMMDLVESSLSDQVEGRAFFINVTFTESITSTYTAVFNSTVTPSCYTTTAAIANCTTSTARALEPEAEMAPMESAVVTRSDGVPASLADIMPTPALDSHHPEKMNAQPHHRLDPNQFDAVVYPNEPLQSGRIEWQEVKAEGLQGCGRSGNGRRPRIVMPTVVTSTVNFTSTSTSVMTATTSLITFTIPPVVTCTTAGFMFTVPAC